jgi:hypothetical protein
MISAYVTTSIPNLFRNSAKSVFHKTRVVNNDEKIRDQKKKKPKNK